MCVFLQPAGSLPITHNRVIYKWDAERVLLSALAQVPSVLLRIYKSKKQEENTSRQLTRFWLRAWGKAQGL
jgi:hypothetical protein